DEQDVEMFIEGVQLPGRAGRVRLMTIAPEVEGCLELIGLLTARGVKAFIGHSQAQPETLNLALEAGARHITHCPNALDPLHHRRPGAVGWGLVQQDVTLDCIADFQHTDALMLKLIYHCKGSDRVALISDAILPAGLGDGSFTVWGEQISVTKGRTALANSESNTIAGSVITMLSALKNMVSIGVPIVEAIKMASLGPARAAGIDQTHGSIAEGKKADLIVLNDDLDPILSVVDGLL